MKHLLSIDDKNKTGRQILLLLKALSKKKTELILLQLPMQKTA